MYHFGVVKTLAEEGLLPKVISGSSVGSLIAAILCTSKDNVCITLTATSVVNTDPLAGAAAVLPTKGHFF
jgi:predicted acylesterase/phospholipase RssA